MYGLQTFPESYLWGAIGSLVSVLIIVVGAYVSFVLRTIKRQQDNASELFRDYKRDTALAIQELYDCKNQCVSRLDKIEVELTHVLKEHEKNHG